MSKKPIPIVKRSVGRPPLSFEERARRKLERDTDKKLARPVLQGELIPASDVMTGKGTAKPWSEALRMELVQADPTLMRRLARALIDKAAAGDVAALKEVADRLDGKTVQSVEAKVDSKITITTDDSRL